MIEFGKRIKELRLENGLTLEEVAKDFNVYRQTVSRWEQGVNQPDFEIVVKLAEYFKVTVDYLFGLQD